MYCTKCGKEARVGDVYCSGCGSKLGAKKGNGWIWLVIAIAVVAVVTGVNVGREPAAGVAPVETFAPVVEREEPSLEKPQINTGEMLPEEPKEGDVLESSTYSDGRTRRSVSQYTGTAYVTDYRPDGTLLRDTTIYYDQDGSFASIRVTNYDSHGNPTDTTETLDNGELWLYLYNRNTYDEKGRPLILAEYNRMSYPLCIYEFTYNADGSYTQVCTEYRGYVYEYDREYNPLGTTSIFSRSTTTFSAEGDVIDQYIEDFG